MNRTKVIASTFLILVSLVRPAIVAGQIDDWRTVAAEPVGRTLVVELKDARRVEGKLTAVTDAALTLERNNRNEALARADIKRVYRKGGGSRGKSAAIGGAIGAGAGAGISAAALGATGGSDSTGAVVGVFLAAGAGIGAAVGALFGGGKRTLIYEAR